MMMRTILGVVLLVAGPQALAAHSLTELLGRAPPPPASAAIAGGWVDGGGEVNEPRYLRLAADIKGDSDAQTAASTQTAYANSGVDIDQSRIQDPAYQEEMGQKYASMTPEQAMAMAMQSQAGMMQEAQRVAQDPPEVRAAFQSYQDLMTQQGTAGEKYYALVEQRAQADIIARYDPKQAALGAQMLGGGEGCDDACVARENAHNRALWKKKLYLAGQELGEWNALFARARGTRESLVATAQARLAATGFGAKAQSNSMKQALSAYHLTVLSQIGELLQITREATTRNARVAAGAKAAGAL